MPANGNGDHCAVDTFLAVIAGPELFVATTTQQFLGASLVPLLRHSNSTTEIRIADSQGFDKTEPEESLYLNLR